MKTNIYLTFDGNCEAAVKFYEQALGARPGPFFRYGESPMADKVPADKARQVMHTRFELADQILMASDALCEGTGTKSGFALSLNVEAPEEAERLFNALSDGGNVTMPMAETFWAHRFGMVTDKFGTPWMVNCEKPME